MFFIQRDTAGRPGFYELLTGEANPEDVLITYDKNETLFLIPGSRSVSSTAEVLSSPRTGEILKRLKETVDVVILDTPPRARMSDATACAQYVDGVDNIIRQDYAKPERIREGVEMFTDTSARILGCALNDASEGITGYGYGYGYGYGRIGGYGSGSYYRRPRAYGASEPGSGRRRKSRSAARTGQHRREQGYNYYTQEEWEAYPEGAVYDGYAYDRYDGYAEDGYYEEYGDDGGYYEIGDDDFSEKDAYSGEYGRSGREERDLEMIEF